MSARAVPELHFELIVPGWNCLGYVRPCWESIARQRPGPYTLRAHFFDDDSTDGTWRAMQELPHDARLYRWSGSENLGAAHARHWLLGQVHDPEAVCVLLDMDDRLEPWALATVAAEYLRHPKTWLTYGSWRPDTHQGMRQARMQNPYPDAVVRDRSYRQHTFCAGPLRTFRRHLVDAIRPSHLQDADGRWLQCCTDLAIMYPLLEQCAPDRIRYVREVVYVYSWRRPLGTVTRYGPAIKAAQRAHLADMPPLPLKP